jgi:gliding motility-associated-like protein
VRTSLYKIILVLFSLNIFCAFNPVSAQSYNNPVIIANGTWAISDMIVDPAGNLFYCGYKYISGATDGRIYEMKKTPMGYDPNPVLIASDLGVAWNLVMDTNGNLFCLDANKGSIFKVSSLGGGNYNSTPILITTGLGNSCMGLAIDKTSGNLYSLHYYTGKVYEITNSGGVYSSSPTVIATGVGSFSDITIDNAGNLFITSGFYGTLYSLPRVNGVYSTVFSQLATGLNNPTGITIDACGNFFICNQGNNTIYEVIKAANGYNPAPVFITSGISIPTFITVDKEGNLFSNNTSTGDIYLVTKNNPGISISTANLQVCANSVVVFTASITNAGPGSFEYHWKKNGNDVGTNSSTYTDNTLNNNDIIYCNLVGISSCYTVSSDSLKMSVSSIQSPSISISSNANSICAGSQVLFNAITSGVTNAVTYQWKKNGVNVGSNTSAYSDNGLNNGDVINCILTSSNTCVTSNTAISNDIIMTVDPVVRASVSITPSANNICYGTAVTFTSTITNGGTNPQYTWFKNGTNLALNSPIYTDNSLNNGDYIMCAMRSDLACAAYPIVASNEITMIVIPKVAPTISITSTATAICRNTLVTFMATSVNGGSSPAYQWRKNNVNVGSNSITYLDNNMSSGDIISCVLTSNSNCLSTSTATSNNIAITILPDPIITLDHTNSLCEGDSRQLNAGSFSSYLWNDGSTQRTLLINNTGTYYVTVADNNGCTASDTAIITTLLPLPTAFLPIDTSICTYGKLDLKPLKSYNNYLWNTNATTSSINVTSPGLYWLQVTDNNNCKERDSIIVNPKECMTGFHIPSAFTPNNDGRNDKFRPLLFGNVKNYKFVIYNRWGQVVFQTKEIGKGWDGTFGGIKQDPTIFVWTCTYQLEGEKIKAEKGTVLLVR